MHTLWQKGIRFRHPDYDPDRAQKLISSSVSWRLSTRNISFKSMHAFLGNLAHRQTNERGRAGEKHIHPSLSEVNKNLAVANRSRVSCAHNTLSASIGLNITPWPWNLSQGHSRSLKVVPFESLGTAFYSTSIVTTAVSLAISKIFRLKEWPDIEIWAWGRSRSLKMARFDRPCMTFY